MSAENISKTNLEKIIAIWPKTAKCSESIYKDGLCIMMLLEKKKILPDMMSTGKFGGIDLIYESNTVRYAAIKVRSDYKVTAEYHLKKEPVNEIVINKFEKKELFEQLKPFFKFLKNKNT